MPGIGDRGRGRRRPRRAPRRARAAARRRPRAAPRASPCHATGRAVDAVEDSRPRGRRSGGGARGGRASEPRAAGRAPSYAALAMDACRWRRPSGHGAGPRGPGRRGTAGRSNRSVRLAWLAARHRSGGGPATRRRRVGPALRRGHHRRRPQRPRQRRLPRPGRPEDARPRAAPRPRRRRRDRGALPGLPVLGLLLRRLAAPAGDHPRARAARATASTSCRSTGRSPRSATGDGPEGRRRRLPLAGQRPRPDDPRAAPLVGDRRRGVRGVRPAHGRDGPLHQADPRDHAARPDLARPAAAAAARRPRSGASSSCRSASRRSSSS